MVYHLICVHTHISLQGKDSEDSVSVLLLRKAEYSSTRVLVVVREVI